MSSGEFLMMPLLLTPLGWPGLVATSLHTAHEAMTRRALEQSLNALLQQARQREAFMPAGALATLEREYRALLQQQPGPKDPDPFRLQPLYALRDRLVRQLAQAYVAEQLHHARLEQLGQLLATAPPAAREALLTRAARLNLGDAATWRALVRETRALTRRPPSPPTERTDDEADAQAWLRQRGRARAQDLFAAASVAPADPTREELEALRVQIEALTPLLSTAELARLRAETDPSALRAALQEAWARWVALHQRVQRIQAQYKGLRYTATDLDALLQAYRKGDYGRVEQLLAQWEAREQDPDFQRNVVAEQYLRALLPDYEIQWLEQGLVLEGDGAQALVRVSDARWEVEAWQETEAFCQRMADVAQQLGLPWQPRRARQSPRARHADVD